MTLDHFKVEKAGPVEALQVLWKTALGREPQILKFEIANTAPQPGPPISLNLINKPVREIVGYIAELSGARWRLECSTPFGLKIVIEPILTAGCREPVDAVVLNLSNSKAKSLGLQPGQSMTEVMNELGSFGVSFDRFHFASYDAKTGVLTMLGAKSEIDLVASLVRLTNADMKIEKPAKSK